ncbi:REP-associated tyrosine transposase [Parvicella tangerina]|uniref:Transposase IS200-like domain-containing protein n=1 Tax=Parvicella tangerina TaxID=2829795 RepID=A0A916NHZ0_9FLAO|nr:transposase [Parvicella tangerina]CAG5084048.1 hypothetical protein CRYO30217_02361 [Parvicella tangerina]
MSRNWRVYNQNGLHFVSFAVVGWIDVFTRASYKEILIDSFKYCQEHKGLELYSWCIMSNHVHFIGKAKEGFELSNILRDFKRHTSKQVIKAIQENPQESRKEWMLSIFKKSGEHNSNNTTYQFWRQDNKPIELYKAETIDIKMNYIHNNPVEDGYVEKAEDYLYSSARDYAGMQGKLKIEGVE